MPVRNRRLSVVAAAIVLAVAVLATGCTKNAQAHETAVLINNERSRRGIRTAQLHGDLVNKAQAWADHMAATGRVSHSVLSANVGKQRWRYLAENVGWARSVGEMHSLFMNSASHRANMLDGRYSKYGTGVAIRNGRYYVVHVYGG